MKGKKFNYKIDYRRNVEVITRPFKEEEEEEEEEEPSTIVYNKKNIPDCSFYKLGLYVCCIGPWPLVFHHLCSCITSCSQSYKTFLE